MNYFNDRAIDDAGLNQDSTYDKKDEEDFDNSDDFHKYDHTEKAATTPEESTETKAKSNNDNFKDALNTSGHFDGTIAI